MNELKTKESLILGQKYAFAVVSLVLGIFCFVNLLGLEKPIALANSTGNRDEQTFLRPQTVASETEWKASLKIG